MSNIREFIELLESQGDHYAEVCREKLLVPISESLDLEALFPCLSNHLGPSSQGSVQAPKVTNKVEEFEIELPDELPLLDQMLDLDLYLATDNNHSKEDVSLSMDTSEARPLPSFQSTFQSPKVTHKEEKFEMEYPHHYGEALKEDQLVPINEMVDFDLLLATGNNHLKKEVSLSMNTSGATPPSYPSSSKGPEVIYKEEQFEMFPNESLVRKISTQLWETPNPEDLLQLTLKQAMNKKILIRMAENEARGVFRFGNDIHSKLRFLLRYTPY